MIVSMRRYLEPLIHILFWLFIFSAVNVDWTADWFDRSLRHRTPAPLLVLSFPFFFYTNALWLTPRYFSRSKWMYFLGFGVLVFLLPEILRILWYIRLYPGTTFQSELFSRDSLIFGAPSSLIIALNTSFIYRFTKDWFINKKTIRELQANQGKKIGPAYENIALLSGQQVEQLRAELSQLMQKQKPFLHPDFSLRDLAEALHTTEKKMSYLLNQKMNTTFYDYLNRHRIETFKQEVTNPENSNLSMVGVALNCGFSSKSSFYRAFKNEVGKTPGEWMKSA